ncbi:MAG: preprotein translocase subunit SecE [Brevundimonas sp.]|uniref:preprotein translocase subunit SecE n=1 Tax=Brevundimonas sp. TaxID=1871086 RepID=UPI0028D74061|nr:preprotein translocase subunit SecE [uncultured Brevundimonas sp.]
MAKAKTPGKRPQANAKPQLGAKAQAAGGAAAIAVDSPEPKKPRTSPAQFFSQVRAEGRKIVWPSRKETWITSVMVFIMVIIASIFFWIVDTGLGFAFRWIIGLGS